MHILTDEKCILDQYSDVFTGLGCTEYTIQLLNESLHSNSTEAKVKHTWKYEFISCVEGANNRVIMW